MTDLLNLRALGAAYGRAEVLWDVALDMKAGDSVTVLGRNGVGKTTLLKTIMGQVRASAGHVYWHGDDVTELPPHRRARGRAPPGPAAARRHPSRNPRRRRSRRDLPGESVMTIEVPGQLLNLRSVSAAYGNGQVLWDVAFDLNKGDAAAILGRNGVGKSTLLKTIMGQLRATAGHLYWHAEDITAMAPHQRARAGIGFVPQGRHVFPHLTVRENLEVGLSALAGKPHTGPRAVPDMVFDLFPKLTQIAERKAGVLSGGEQQQLAIGRALAGRPELLLLDEPTEGIQPNIVQQIEDALVRVRKELGVAILIVEQNLDFAWSFADRYFVMQRGRIVKEGRTAGERAADVAALVHI